MMWNLKAGWALGVLLLTALANRAQVSALTIEQCYELARQNYPLIKKHDLIARSSGFSIENAGKLYLPQLTIGGQASYQSQTIRFPDVPGIPFPQISKDQYKIQAEVSQQIYDGGNTKNQQEAIRVSEAIRQQSLEVNLYALKDRVTQLYFSILLMNEQLAQNDIRKTTLQSAAGKAAAAFKNGNALRSNVDELQAEVASTDMTGIEFRENRKAYLQMLGIFIGKTLDENTQLAVPAQQLTEPVVRRPELTLYDLQKKTYDVQEKQLRTDYMPKLNAFVQGAYGRPTLNFLENKFGAWWLGGLRLSWNLGSLYTLKNNRSLLKNNRETTELDKETFLFNTHLTLGQQNGEIQKWLALTGKDDAVISLRASVTRSAQAQLDNGVITVHEFIAKLNEENMARQTKILHATQLLQAEYNYKNTSGN